MKNLEQLINNYLKYHYRTTRERANTKQLYNAICMAAVSARPGQKSTGKRACYFSAEFLMGRLVFSNLMNMNLLSQVNDYLNPIGLDVSIFEEVEDNALGNGGLGRLAACFLDSAATHGIPLDGYGIRYRYGLFRQKIEDGFQREYPDDWLNFGDPWSTRREDESVLVTFADQTVRAVPYDTPVIGWNSDTVNTLRLWQAEPVGKINLDKFSEQQYVEAFEEANQAQAICAQLYPNDDTNEGKKLRLKQQYFFSSASLQSLLRGFESAHGTDYNKFPDMYAIQLNDTHPVVSIPELLRLLMEREVAFDAAFDIVKRTFAYTNHTVMAEALETWDINIFAGVLPNVYAYFVMINDHLRRELSAEEVPANLRGEYMIINGGRIHMARAAVYASHSTNGVAQVHTDILKNDVLRCWFDLYPERFNNKTNGVTQRRWLRLCNPELAQLLTEKIGDSWITNLDELKRLEAFVDDEDTLARFEQIKQQKKVQLAEHVKQTEGFILNPECIFDVQIKRLHEYKRQLLNALAILDLYFGIKEKRVWEFSPTAFIFGAKAAPGYHRAKAVIKLINEISKLAAADPDTRDLIQVLFVQNYNVSYAERIIPAADVSEQISTAGTEASGTGNMKLMMNGAVTLGTLDGANIEIVEQAGIHNSYIFGANLGDITRLKGSYDPRELYSSTPRIRRVLDTLIDGTLRDGGTGMFESLYECLLHPTYNNADHYFVLHDFITYCDTREILNRDYQNRREFLRKCWMNIANAGKFSSDRTVMEYAGEVWGVL